MITATKECSFDAAHRLSFHKGKCRNLHGHTYKVQVTFFTDVLENGMVKDFYNIKELLNEIVDEWDHSTVLYEGDAFNASLADYLKSNEMKCILLPCEPTVENMCKIFFTHFEGRGLNVCNVRVYETPTSYAEAKR